MRCRGGDSAWNFGVGVQLYAINEQVLILRLGPKVNVWLQEGRAIKAKAWPELQLDKWSICELKGFTISKKICSSLFFSTG